MKISVLMAIVAESLHTLIAGHPAFLAFMPGDSAVNWGYFIGAFVGIPGLVAWLGGKQPAKTNRVALSTLLVGAIWLGVLLFSGAKITYSPASICSIFVSVYSLYLIYLVASSFKNSASRDLVEWRSFFLPLSTLLGSLTIATHAGLLINRVIFPATWDYHAYRIDGAFWGLATQAAIANAKAAAFFKNATLTIYGILVLVFYGIIGVAIRENATERLNIWRTLLTPFAIALLLYSVLPLSGPMYAFFDGRFPLNLPAALEVAPYQVVLPPAHRNGMPSMHLTGAILVWMITMGLKNRAAKFVASALVAGTAWSTLATGEHYFLDLVVALPFSAVLGITCISPQLLLGNTLAKFSAGGSAIVFLGWLILLKTEPVFLSQHWNIVRVMAGLSLTVFAISMYAYCQQYTGTERESNLGRSRIESKPAVPLWINVVFVCSGFAGLVYEVVFAKALALSFGSTALASYTVLATYMGGMALGSWAGGKLADRVGAPLAWYGFSEIAIGVYAVLTPSIFKLCQHLYVVLSTDMLPGSTSLMVLRVALGALSLGIPTVFMGATLPLMFCHSRKRGVSGQRSISRLYASNVAGAAFGALISAYAILPTLGRNGTTYLAALASLLIGLYAIEKNKREDLTYVEALSPPPLSSEQLPSQGNAYIAYAALVVGGAVCLGLEIDFMHMLAVVAGNSVYAFGLMLSTFLAGLWAGSLVGSALCERVDRVTVIGFAQCGIVIAIAICVHGWDDLSSYFSSFGIFPVKFGFSARETIRALVCMTVMAPAAIFIGMSYPCAASLVSDSAPSHRHGRGIGRASAVNTLGNIAGVLLVGFWLLPSFGSRDTFLVLAVMSFIISLCAFFSNSKTYGVSTSNLIKATLLACAGLLIMAFPASWNYRELSQGANVYFSGQDWGEVVDHAESVEGGITTVTKNESGVLTLLTNGKFQGNDSKGGEMLAQESFALFPLLHSSARNSALVIGYGTGMTARVLHERGFQRIDIAELSKDIVALSNKYFSSINHEVTQQTNVFLNITDGRNYLLTQSRKFDLISIEVTSIWFAGAANLYSQDFYALAKSRLKKGGILQQWVQLHHISPLDLAYIVGSARSEFKYVWLYVRGGQGVLVASNDEGATDRPGLPSLRESCNLDSCQDIVGHHLNYLVLSPKGVDRLIEKTGQGYQALVSTDDNLYLEYSTPRGNALGDVQKSNIEFFTAIEAEAQASLLRSPTHPPH